MEVQDPSATVATVGAELSTMRPHYSRLQETLERRDLTYELMAGLERSLRDLLYTGRSWKSMMSSPPWKRRSQTFGACLTICWLRNCCRKMPRRPASERIHSIDRLLQGELITRIELLLPSGRDVRSAE